MSVIHTCVLLFTYTLLCLGVCRYTSEDERKGLLPTLRDVSRQEYLKKREEAKLVSAVVRLLSPVLATPIYP